MRIQYMSDLHMELYDNSRYIKAKEFDANGDVSQVIPSTCETSSHHRRGFGTGPQSARLCRFALQRTFVRC